MSVEILSNTEFGYTGTLEVALVGNKIILQGTGPGLSVVGGLADYRLPAITVTQSSGPLDLKFSTSGLAGQYGNFANNYFTFNSNVKTIVGTPRTAATSCIPADGVQTVVDSYPTLNSQGAVKVA